MVVPRPSGLFHAIIQLGETNDMDFILGLACGVFLALALVVLDARIKRARKIAAAKRQFMLELSAADYSVLSPQSFREDFCDPSLQPFQEDFFFQPRARKD